jgi:hypothetical protein
MRRERGKNSGALAVLGLLAAVCAGVVAVAPAAAGGAPLASTAGKRACSSSDPIYSLTTTRVLCGNARRIARAVVRGNRNPLRFKCGTAVNGPESLRVRCTRGKRLVRFIERTPGG